MSSTKTSRTGSIIAFVLSGLTVIAAGLLVFNRQYVSDQLSVWSYTPSSQVASINERVNFTDEGTFTLYATKPEVLGKESFNSLCPRQEPGSPILGCYTGDDRVYVYDVTNVQLDGMKEVTAAHEMLHAVWHRMSDEDKDAMTTELTAVYEAKATDELKERMAYYDRTQPGEFANELHSILATEVHELTPALEQHYVKYFEDRQAVVALHDKYSAVYAGLQAQIDSLYTQLEALSASINQQSAAYDVSLKAYEAQASSYESRANAGAFTSIAQIDNEYYALMRTYNALEAQRIAINADIVRHGELFKQYEQVAAQIEVLNKSIDSIETIEGAPAV